MSVELILSAGIMVFAIATLMVVIRLGEIAQILRWFRDFEQDKETRRVLLRKPRDR